MSLKVFGEGRMVADAELRFTPQGIAVASFRIATNKRVRNADGSYGDGEPSFWSCQAWRDMGENVCEELVKGQLAVFTGEISQRSYENKDGEKRTVYEITVDSIGPSLRWKDKNQRPQRPAASSADAGYDDSPPFLWSSTGPPATCSASRSGCSGSG